MRTPKRRVVQFALLLVCLHCAIGVAQAQLQITTVSIPPATLGVPYSFQFQATGGVLPYVWSYLGSLPPGLNLSAGGLLSGTPTQAGVFTDIDVIVQDSPALVTPAIDSQVYSITVTVAPLVITTQSPLPSGAPGVSYGPFSFAATGGDPPYDWSLVGGTLPPGLNLSLTGVLQGTPTQSGTYQFRVEVLDSSEDSAQRDFQLTIGAPLVITTRSPLPGGTRGVSYGPLSFTATGGVPPYAWSLTSGTLPPGLSLSSAGVLQGAPAQEGAFQFRVRVRDNAGSSEIKDFQLTIGPPLEISTQSPLPEATAGQSYTVPLTAIGGSGEYFWRIIQGALPPGLQLSASGVISGVPTSSGEFVFQVRVNDSAQASADAQFRIAVVGALAITPASLPNAAVGVAYSQEFSGAGGQPPYSWFAIGQLPPGLQFSSSGLLSGTPTTVGTFSFIVRLADSRQARLDRLYTVVVEQPLPEITVVNESPLPEATIDAPYSQLLTAVNGVAPYVWVILEGELPPGLTLNPNGLISGTPSAIGGFVVQVQATDAEGRTGSKVLAIDVVRPALQITTATLPDAAAGASYSLQFQVSGGLPGYTWALTGGGVPVGMFFGIDGVLSGVPAAVGEFPLTVEVTDSAGATATRQYTLRVATPAVPGLRVENLPGQTAPAQQQLFQLALNEPFPLQLTGQATLEFAPDATNPADDPAVQFLTGGRTAQFVLAPGQTVPVYQIAGGGQTTENAIQAGSVAGTVTLRVTLSLDGQDVTPQPQPTQQMRIARTVPVINSARVVRTANGFEVRVVGISSPRDMTQARFQFLVTAGVNLQTTQATVQVAAPFNTWYQNAASAAFGSAFEYVQPFTVSGGASNVVSSVTVTLTNSQGDSLPASASF